MFSIIYQIGAILVFLFSLILEVFMDNNVELVYPNLDPHTKAELEAADDYRNEVANSENGSNPTNFEDNGGSLTSANSEVYYGNIHYGSDSNANIENIDQSTSDIKIDDQLTSDVSNLAIKKVDHPIDDNPIDIVEEQYLDSEFQPLETGNLPQTHNEFTNPEQGPEQSLISLPLPEFDLTPDVPILSLEQLIEPTLGDATLNQDGPQDLSIGSAEISASENFWLLDVPSGFWDE